MILSSSPPTKAVITKSTVILWTLLW